MELYITWALILCVLGAIILFGSRRTTAPASDAELLALRAENAALGRDLAVERVHALRVPELEGQLAGRTERAERLQIDNGKLQTEFATAREALSRVEATLADTLNRSTKLEAGLVDATGRLEALRQEKAQGEERLATSAARLDAGQTELADLRARLAVAETTLREKAELEATLASVREALLQEQRKSAEKLAQLQDVRDEMTREFKLAANTIMQEHGETFKKQNKDQIDVVLTPLREKLVEFQQGLTNAHTESAKDRATLAEQIRQLSATSAVMTSETSNLTRALKGKAQTQGAWGEMILATILEKSGLRAGEEYIVQASHTTEDGQRLRPDVIVNLPGGQRIVIDAKVSLTAFEAHVNGETDDERALQLQRHLLSLRTHIKTLGGKDYHAHTNGGVDYVIMFVPIEGALAVALQEAPDLTGMAIEANVNIATPTTLMIALRTAASVWQVERRNKNAEEIASRAGQLYDKFVGFTGDMEQLGGRLGLAQKSYGEAMSKLTTGSGNVFRQFEMLKSLGAKASKTLPVGLLDSDPGLVHIPQTDKN